MQDRKRQDMNDGKNKYIFFPSFISCRLRSCISCFPVACDLAYPVSLVCEDLVGCQKSCIPIEFCEYGLLYLHYLVIKF